VVQAVFDRGHKSLAPVARASRFCTAPPTPSAHSMTHVHWLETERDKCEVQRSLQNLWASVRNWCNVTFLGPGIWNCLRHSFFEICSYTYLAPLTPLQRLGEPSLKLRYSEEKLKLCSHTRCALIQVCSHTRCALIQCVLSYRCALIQPVLSYRCVLTRLLS
jgi:hypothetical protein